MDIDDMQKNPTPEEAIDNIQKHVPKKLPDKGFEKDDDLASDNNKETARQALKHQEDKHQLSIYYFKVIIWFIIGYVIVITVLFVFIGMRWLEYDPSVVYVFLGATSIEIIGLAYVVTKWLFPYYKT